MSRLESAEEDPVSNSTSKVSILITITQQNTAFNIQAAGDCEGRKGKGKKGVLLKISKPQAPP